MQRTNEPPLTYGQVRARVVGYLTQSKRRYALGLEPFMAITDGRFLARAIWPLHTMTPMGAQLAARKWWRRLVRDGVVVEKVYRDLIFELTYLDLPDGHQIGLFGIGHGDR